MSLRNKCGGRTTVRPYGITEQQSDDMREMRKGGLWSTKRIVGTHHGASDGCCDASPDGNSTHV